MLPSIIRSKKLASLVAGAVVLVLLLGIVLTGCSSASLSKPKVVTSTSLIMFIVEQVGGDMVDVVNVIPPAQCPGHFDVKPGDIKDLADAELFLMHGWQGEKFTDELIASANNPDIITVKINIEGNWMTPQVQQQAVDEIVPHLCQIDSENCSKYQEAAQKYKDTVEVRGSELKQELDNADVSAVNVMCAEQQAGFVKWAGLNVVGTFGRPDSLTPQVVKELVDTGREKNVSLIIDNLQSGEDAGAGIAEELGCSRIILSNFPGGFENTETWEKAINRNVELILEAAAP